MVLPMSNPTAEYPYVGGWNCLLTLPFSFSRSDLVVFNAYSTALFDIIEGNGGYSLCT